MNALNRPGTGLSPRLHELDSVGSAQRPQDESPLSPIIAALTPDIRERNRARPVQPLPMVAVADGRRASSITYAICRIDESGRFGDKDIIDAASWISGERLQIQIVHGVVAFAPSADGPLVVEKRRRIAVPAQARRVLELEPKDKALLAAAPDSRIVIVYPKHIVDAMLRRFHSSWDNT